jgi:hypothetical protein
MDRGNFLGLNKDTPFSKQRSRNSVIIQLAAASATKATSRDKSRKRINSPSTGKNDTIIPTTNDKKIPFRAVRNMVDGDDVAIDSNDKRNGIAEKMTILNICVGI